MEAEDGIINGLSAGKIWAEMSTTDESEVRRLGALVSAKGAAPVDCPVSGAAIAPPREISRSLLVVSAKPLTASCRY